MTDTTYTMTATHECGYTGTLAALALHDCQIHEQGGRCEDYPCCGHTDGDGCQTLPSHTAAYWTEGPGRAHLMCDHEAGICDAWEDDEEPECDGDHECVDCETNGHGTPWVCSWCDRPCPEGAHED